MLLQAFKDFSHSQGLDPDNNYPLDMINGLEIFNDDGVIELNEQLPERQRTVTVIAFTAPELTGNGYLKVVPRGTYNNVIVKLPQAFAQPLKILSQRGEYHHW